MTVTTEVRGVIARALCTEDSEGRGPWPCPTCVADAGDVVAALVEAGYFQTDDGAVGSGGGASPSAGTGDTAPSSLPPRLFELVRHSDPSGITGTGIVAWGAKWPDGTASLRWGGEHPSTVAWANVERILAVHGHQGATEIRWLDGGA